MMSRYALISVADKEGIVEFASELLQLDFKILATGGTLNLLKENNISVQSVSDYTKEKEMLSGRVKTLHPSIFAGILFDRNRDDHLQQISKANIHPIDLVAVNFYPFAEQQKKHPNNNLLDFIDIGGPSLVRSAAKNYKNCICVCHSKDYKFITNSLKTDSLTEEARKNLAYKAFSYVRKYDQCIETYFQQQVEEKNHNDRLPEKMTLDLEKKVDLSYGENPHQKAALFTSNLEHGKDGFEVLKGDSLSYNNLLDLDSGYRLLGDLSAHNSAIILKHNNPCAVAIDKDSFHAALSKSLTCDPLCAFGGVLMTNFAIDDECAKKLKGYFFDCIAAPSVTSQARVILNAKKRCKLIKIPSLNSEIHSPYINIKNIFSGFLLQDSPESITPSAAWTAQTQYQLEKKDLENLNFAMIVAKHVKSNAIVICSDDRTIGIGAGQMSRIDASKLAIQKAIECEHSLQDTFVASDAFFPFADCIELFAQHKIKAIVEPGGSKRDHESIDVARDKKMSLYFTGQRQFKH
jgi:phosphoribosylaminoimidazolecarboxamide formyltransferase / IMP cyclohydrolase